ncbi:MAG: hypothetical protein ACTSWI_02430, partial [Alphaproteobacteria bacterium]
MVAFLAAAGGENMDEQEASDEDASPAVAEEGRKNKWLKLGIRSLPLIALVVGGVVIAVLGISEYLSLS